MNAFAQGKKNDLKKKNIYFVTAGILINVECKAWARNIKHSRHDKMGVVHFELMID